MSDKRSIRKKRKKDYEQNAINVFTLIGTTEAKAEVKLVKRNDTKGEKPKCIKKRQYKRHVS
jgi:hypothetical protein